MAMTNQFAMLEKTQDTLIDLAIRFGPKLLVAVLFIVAGFYVGRWASGFFSRWLVKFGLEEAIRLLLLRLVRLAVMALFLVMALDNLGVDLLPLIAGLSVAGAGVALAMQGVLSNLTAGLTIIFTRPFRVGEYVSVAGVEGRVEAVNLFSTRLSHTDQSIVVVPNRKIVGEILHNYGHIRQLEMSIAIVSAANLAAVLAAIRKTVDDNPRVLKEPAPVIGVAQLHAATISISVKPWVQVADYVPASGEINRAIVENLRAAGVDYPPSEPPMRVLGAD